MGEIKTGVFYSGSYAVYDCREKSFYYSDEIKEMFRCDFDSRPIWDVFSEDMTASDMTSDELKSAVELAASDETPDVVFTELSLRNNDDRWNVYSVCIIYSRNDEKVTVTFSCTSGNWGAPNKSEHDELTDLMSRPFFAKYTESTLRSLSDEEASGYIYLYLDVQRFKVVNDMFGMTEGDRLLMHIADVIRSCYGKKGAGCRLGSDRFILFASVPENDRRRFTEDLLEKIAACDLPFEIVCNAGIYSVNDKNMAADAMIDRAIIAQTSVKGSYTCQYSVYTEELRKNLLSEQEISGMMRLALEQEQFIVHYQPQYNHSTGMLVGAEALVRWMHPEKGIISPANFVPIFEKNGFITKLDLYVFERACRFIRRCIDRKYHIVPVSTNLTRYDIFSPDFIDRLESVRQKYDVPSEYLRVEITESAAIGNSQFINDAVNRLHKLGYIVEMDDFGSGYSSLNILKEIDFDIIKLDMKFLDSNSTNERRGGTILSSVVRMVNWLGLPVIAEGVETVKQADYLRSIGCDYIQGYLYSKPLPEDKYEALVSSNSIGATIPEMRIIETLNAVDFWSHDSMETLIFNNFVGGAAIFDLKDGELEILRVNKKYIEELRMNLTERDLINNDPIRFCDEDSKAVFREMLDRAISTGEEQECETWRTICSSCCGEERMCIRTNVRMIGSSKGNYLFYAMIRNITAEKNQFEDAMVNEKRFKMAIEQAKVYFWEYNIATHEMRPCFRCMRDLGFPPVLANYPESAIELGTFPPDYADMYRDWHVRIANGEKELEAVIPLTPDRIPFRVRYNTEFDETGRPIKAYGSATLVID